MLLFAISILVPATAYAEDFCDEFLTIVKLAEDEFRQVKRFNCERDQDGERCETSVVLGSYGMNCVYEPDPSKEGRDTSELTCVVRGASYAEKRGGASCDSVSRNWSRFKSEFKECVSSSFKKVTFTERPLSRRRGEKVNTQYEAIGTTLLVETENGFGVSASGSYSRSDHNIRDYCSSSIHLTFQVY